MPSKKLHTAFVSCPTELREERRAVLDVLLSFDAFPVSTEFFTIQSTNCSHESCNKEYPYPPFHS